MRLAYFSPVPWASFAQRPHSFVSWFHERTGGEVLWVDPYPTRLPALSDLARLKCRAAGRDRLPAAPITPPWLTVVTPRGLPLEPIPGSGSINHVLWRKVLTEIHQFLRVSDCVIGVGKPSELALRVLRTAARRPAFYDAMDDFPAFYEGLSRKAMAIREHELANRVSAIFVSSSALAARFLGFRDKVTVALNAYSPKSLQAANTAPAIPTRPVLGYVGTIGRWFDWEFVIALARQNPDKLIRLIGPNYASPSTKLPVNIEIHPACDHETAMREMRQFSVGLIPFKRNDLTRSVDPIKYYEYRALGLPIISTAFGEMALRSAAPGVFLVDDPALASIRLREALAYHAEPRDLEEFRCANTWDARFDNAGLLPALGNCITRGL